MYLMIQQENFNEEYNKSFSKYWKDKTGQEVTIKQSHGGSGNKQEL